MDIYTVTFSNTTNVGAALQEYALQEYLDQQGHNVKVINYRPQKMEEREALLFPLKKGVSLIDIFNALVLMLFKLIRKNKFRIFNKHCISFTKRCYNYLDIQKLEQPDIYIVGSDQVWNQEITGEDKGYLLDFNTTAKKISYAASAGKDQISDKFLSEISKVLQTYSAISVREFTLQNAIQAICLSAVQQVMDPVFLLPRAHYCSISIKPKISDYILIYEVEKNENCILIANLLAQKYNLKTVQINRLNNRYHVDKLYPTISPTEFLGLVEHASYVITNSFHAVAFSLIMEKQFWVIKLKNLSSRIDSIMKIAQLEDRVLYDSIINSFEPIYYDNIKKNMMQKIEESKQFLLSNI